MENDNNPKTNSSEDEQLVSETSIGSNREKKADAAPENQSEISTNKGSQSQNSRESKMSESSCDQGMQYNNMICFSSYYLLVHLKWKVIVNFLKAAKGIVRQHCTSAILHSLQFSTDSKPDVILRSRILQIVVPTNTHSNVEG